MKIAVIGNGNVGLATFAELQKLEGINELVLIGRNQSRIKAEVDDYRDSAILRPYGTPSLSYGDYSKTEGADITVYAAGAPQKVGQSRLELTKGNVEVVDQIFEKVNKYNKDSIVIVLSNPVDVLTYVVVRVSGRPREKVIGTGTLLDSARCVKIISDFLEVSPKSVNLFVVGEHGDSSVALLSSASLIGMGLDEYLSNEIGGDVSFRQEKIAALVRSTAGRLIASKGFTAYGVASAAARLIHEIIHDSNAILPLSVVLDGEYGLDSLAISVPCQIGKEGIKKIQNIRMNDAEKEAFEKSAGLIKETISGVEE